MSKWPPNIALMGSLMFIAGCDGSRTVQSWEIERASEYCETHRGIHHIELDNLFHADFLRCADGNVVTFPPPKRAGAVQ